jgi:tryptophanyl-tRNA synthetase
MKKRILSGMRPTGPLHLGHLAGALENWVKLQDEYECFFMVADWHALMSEYEDPSKISYYIYEMVLDWLSCGIDFNKSTIFVQSDIPEHLELDMILSALTPLGWLERCPTYKEQMREDKTRDLSTYAFLGYPVLQAADILLYKAERVPVGEDQKAHLELTREIVRRFNNLYGETLVEPKEILTNTPRLLGLDGRKMSKSFNNYIALSDSPEAVRKKVSGMFTDPNRIKLSDKGHPDKCNVHSYYSIFAPRVNEPKVDLGKLEGDCKQARIGCTECKTKLADMLVKFLSKISENREKFEVQNIKDILSKGTEKARKVSGQTLLEVRQAMKFILN